MENSIFSASEPTRVDEVVVLLRDLLHALLDSSMPAWLDLQMTLPQLRTLFLIAHGETSSVMQLSQHLGVGEPTASHLIDKLVRAGLVVRKEDPQDRRRALVQLSQGGGEQIEKLLGWENSLGGPLQRMTQDELAALQRGLSAILNNFHEKGGLRE